MKNLSIELGPVAQQIADIVDVKLKDLDTWFKEHPGEILKTINAVAAGCKKIEDALNWLNSFKPPVIFDLPAFWQKWLSQESPGAKALAPWQPGTKITPQVPASMDWRYGGTTGGGTTDAQAQQQIEKATETAQKAQLAAPPTKYMPYQRELSAGTSTGSAAVRGKEVTAGSESVGTVAGNKDIAAERERVIKQLSEPGMRELVASTISHEQGGAEGRGDVLESLVNRSVVTGKHPRDLITGGGRKGSFYGPYRRGEVQATLAKGVPEPVLKQYDALQAQVAAGRNRIQGRTDQGMVNEIHEEFGKKIKVAGEYYGFMGNKGEKNTAAYRAGLSSSAAPQSLAKGPVKAPEPNASLVPAGSRLKDVIKDMNMQQRMSGAGGPMNVTMNPQTTINGASAGQEAAVARQFDRVLQDSNRQLLSQLKEAKNYENRLGYV